MNIKEIKELIDAVCQNEIAELEVERAGVRVRIKKESRPGSAVTAPVLSTPLPPGQTVQPATPSNNESTAITKSQVLTGGTNDDLLIIRSPIVGTFYRAPNPDAEPFVKLGDVVEPGRVLCIIEAMKLMNEIESEVHGEVTKIYVESGEPVEFGQSLFGISPTKRA
jgi:acetyl-CoA carboxylase biotin carboxyl carrier protein